MFSRSLIPSYALKEAALPVSTVEEIVPIVTEPRGTPEGAIMQEEMEIIIEREEFAIEAVEEERVMLDDLDDTENLAPAVDEVESEQVRELRRKKSRSDMVANALFPVNSQSCPLHYVSYVTDMYCSCRTVHFEASSSFPPSPTDEKTSSTRPEIPLPSPRRHSRSRNAPRTTTRRPIRHPQETQRISRETSDDTQRRSSRRTVPSCLEDRYAGEVTRKPGGIEERAGWMGIGGDETGS